MPKWKPKKVVVKYKNIHDKQKVVLQLAKLIYSLDHATDRSRSKLIEPSESKNFGGAS